MTDLTSAEWLTKKAYRKGLDKDALVSANAMLAHVEHEKSFATPEGIYVNAPSANGQGIGPTNATAYTARGGQTGMKFLVPQRRMIHFGELTADIVRNTEAGDDETQFGNILTADIDGATENFGQEINQRLYRDVVGMRALVHPTTAISTTLLTLANPEDAAFFEEGVLVQGINPADGTLRDADAVLVEKVDTLAGTITGTTSWTTTISGLVANDILIRSGFRNISLDGLSGWVPVTPSASFLGVNQTINRARRAGVYVDVSGFAIRPGLLRAFAVFQQQLGNHFDESAPIFMNPSDKMEIVASVEAVKVVDTKLDTKYGVGLKAVEVLGCKIVADRHCPVGQAFMVPKKAFTLGTAGNQPKIDNIDGKMFHYARETGQLQFVLALDGNSYSRAIASIGRIALPVRSV